jgi:hypothetical protein
MNEIISYKICAVKVRNAKLRNYLNKHIFIQRYELNVYKFQSNFVPYLCKKCFLAFSI